MDRNVFGFRGAMQGYVAEFICGIDVCTSINEKPDRLCVAHTGCAEERLGVKFVRDRGVRSSHEKKGNYTSVSVEGCVMEGSPKVLVLCVRVNSSIEKHFSQRHVTSVCRFMKCSPLLIIPDRRI